MKPDKVLPPLHPRTDEVLPPLLWKSGEVFTPLLPDMAFHNTSQAASLPSFPTALLKSPTTSLLDLPSEIRMIIWRYSMISSFPGAIDPAWDDWNYQIPGTPPANPRLSSLLLSRVCYLEASRFPDFAAGGTDIDLRGATGYDSAFASLQGMDDVSLLFKEIVARIWTKEVVYFPVPLCEQNKDRLEQWGQRELIVSLAECQTHLGRHYNVVDVRRSTWTTDWSNSRMEATFWFELARPRHRPLPKDTRWVNRVLRRTKPKRQRF